MSNTISVEDQKVLVARTAIDKLISEGLIYSGMKIGRDACRKTLG